MYIIYCYLIASVTATVSGAIMGLSIMNNGCSRPGVTITNVDLCPLDGETVIISCQTVGPGTYVINGPRGIQSLNSPLTIMTFDLNVHSGTYTCSATSTNVPSSLCGATDVSLTVSGSGQ